MKHDIQFEQIPGTLSFVVTDNGVRTKWKLSKYHCENRMTETYWKLFYGERSRGSYKTKEECLYYFRMFYLEKKAEDYLD